MDSLPPILQNLDFDATAVGVVALLAGLFLLWRWARRRRIRAARALAVTNCGFEYLRNVLVPDGQGSTLHLDFLLLTARGLVVIDFRDVEGNIFGGDQMTEWTVMHRALRYTFPNPQTGLYDRIAAVRALAPELPIEGRAVFTSSGQFPKGLPRHTLMLDSLAAEFPASDRQAMSAVLERWMPSWRLIEKTVTPSKLASPKAAI
jgi:Nuclease-related domain